MKELNDKDFDQTFKTKITEELPAFEEESWLKMERKLRKRDRLVFYRNASIVLLFLSFGLGLYLTNKKIGDKTDPVAINQTKNKKDAAPTEHPVPIKAEELKTAQNHISKNFTPLKSLTIKTHADQVYSPVLAINEPKKSTDNTLLQNTPDSAITEVQEEPIGVKPMEQIIAQTNSDNVDANDPENTLPKTKKSKRKIPISLAISAGPDFNSTSAIVGGKTTVALGLTVGVGLTKKLSVQTGLIYGAKNYSASAYDYTFNNPNTKISIAEVNAACKVLEIPLKASYNISENQKRSIELNAGLSSYLMLKENYTFIYTPESGRNDRLIERTNANQHILSVIDLSATYNIKLKNKKLGLGFEPYVKIPLSGIGEGDVPLKSSGISLKLRYDFNKK